MGPVILASVIVGVLLLLGTLFAFIAALEDQPRVKGWFPIAGVGLLALLVGAIPLSFEPIRIAAPIIFGIGVLIVLIMITRRVVFFHLRQARNLARHW